MKFYDAYSKTIGKEAEIPKQEVKVEEAVTPDNVKQYFESMKVQLIKEVLESMKEASEINDIKDVIVKTDEKSDEVINSPEENTKSIIEKEGE